MCQVNTFMFKESELDGDKLVKIFNIFQSAGFDNFYEYNNPHLRNIRRDLRLFQCGNFCDCGSVITKKVVVDEIVETAESNKLTEIIKKTLDVVGTTYLFSHWYKTGSEIAREKVVLERATKKVPSEMLDEKVYRDMFYNEVLEVSR
ncbi:MAG: hypothetical protein E7345_04650 [Clostridiales bacterium]|nr:hypothetical protein [Clostridiales bacterium]